MKQRNRTEMSVPVYFLLRSSERLFQVFDLELVLFFHRESSKQNTTALSLFALRLAADELIQVRFICVACISNVINHLVDNSEFHMTVNRGPCFSVKNSEKITNWFTSINFRSIQHTPETGIWFLNNPGFYAWLSEDIGLLCPRVFSCSLISIG